MTDVNTYPKISVIIGTRAQLIKTAPVMKEMQDRNIPYRYIYTVQHRETMDDLQRNFGLKNPDYILMDTSRDEAKTMKLFGTWFLDAVIKLFTRRRDILPDSNGIVLTHGDTVTCWWGALIGKLTNNRVMHLESGLRSFNLFHPFPEEINRLITFRLTDIYACPNDWAIQNLAKYRGIKINTFANTQYDAVRMALENLDKSTFKIPENKYVVVSVHRYENVFRKNTLFKIIDTIENIAETFTVVFIMHPVTRKRIDKYDLKDRLQNIQNIILNDRLPFFDFIKLVNSAEFVVTDGGSNQEELSYLGKPTLLLRNATERIEGLGQNAVLSGFDKETIDNFIHNYSKYALPLRTPQTSPSRIIVDWLMHQIAS